MTRLHLHVAPPLSVPQAAASIRNRRTCSTYRWWSQSGCWRWAWATTPPSRCTSEPKSCSKPGPEEPNMGSKVTDGWILRLKLCYSHRDRTEEQSGECSERNIPHVDHVISVVKAAMLISHWRREIFTSILGFFISRTATLWFSS